MNTASAGLRPTVLVTRPIAEAEDTVRRLAGAGFDAIVSPVLAIRPLAATLPDGPWSGLVVTSANAARALAGLDAAHLRGLPSFVVGTTTAATLVHLGFPAPTLLAPDAATLAERMVVMLPPGSTLLHAAGRDRTPGFRERLALTGISLDVVELYSAEPVRTLNEESRRGLEAGTVTAVLHMSRRSAEAFLAAAEASGVRVPALGVLHAAISEKAAEPLQRRGVQRIVTADRPTLDAVIARLRAATPLGYATHSRGTRHEE